MLIARVTGNIVSTVKHPDYHGQKLLILRAVGLDGELYGDELVALDGADKLLVKLRRNDWQLSVRLWQRQNVLNVR